MSVIPLNVGGTVVTSVLEWNREGGVYSSVLCISNLDIDALNNNDDANTTYDLRVGEHCYQYRSKCSERIGEVLKIQPGSSVIIETEESVHLPVSMFGQIVPKVTQLFNGMSPTSAKIDPGYRGKLLVTMFNLGRRTIEYKRGDRFCSFYVLSVQTGARPYGGAQKTFVRPKLRTYFNDRLQMHAGIISLLAMIGTIGAFIYQILQGSH